MATRFKDTIQIGTAALVSLAAATVLYVQGGALITGNLEVSGTLSGAIIHSLTGVTLGDKDGSGNCSTIEVLGGVVTSSVATCP